MTIEYAKDVAGRIETNTRGKVVSKARLDPGKELRNHAGRVYVLSGEAFSVVVKAGGREYVIADGTASLLGRTAIYVRVRAEAGVDEPPKPTEEP